MKNSGLTIILLWSIMWLLISCAPLKKSRMSSITTKKIHKRTKEAIADDHLIQEYEREHKKFHEQGSENGDYLRWPDVDTKNLSIYCRKYLKHAFPIRWSENVTGMKTIIKLHYEKENTSTISIVIGIQCKCMNKSNTKFYYITSAPQPNCVFALNHKKTLSIFNITNKYCDFEDKPLIKGNLKHKQVELFNIIHPHTGQPIAKDEYLLEYELEHQAMLKREGDNNIRIEWPNVKKYQDIDSYCYQYIGACAPRRILETVTGSLKSVKLQYQKSVTNEVVDVTIVICQLSTVSKRLYHMTRAPESNCVYALCRRMNKKFSPFIIIFKHCDFEDSNYQMTLTDYDILDKNVIPKTELKEETFDTLESLKLIPNK